MKMKETPEKTLRIRSQPSLDHIEDTSSIYEECIEKPPPNICNLPVEILEKIIGYVHHRSYDDIRRTCRYMEEVINNFLIHKLIKMSENCIGQCPKSEAIPALRVLKLITEVYVGSSFESIYCKCISSHLRRLHPKPFWHSTSGTRDFLIDLHLMIEEYIGKRSERYQIIRALTVLNLIKAFDVSSMLSIKRRFLWRAEFQLSGISWHHCYYSADILIDLYIKLIPHICSTSRCPVSSDDWHCQFKLPESPHYFPTSPCYLGIHSTPSEENYHSPYYTPSYLDYTPTISCSSICSSTDKSNVTLSICGAEAILNLFSSCLAGKQLQWSTMRTSDHLFTAYLDIEYSNDKFKRIHL